MTPNVRATSVFARRIGRVFNSVLHHVSGAFVAGNSDRACSPVFIVGAPRTGSTILYQALTSQFKISYIDNLAARFYGSLPFAILVSRRVFGDRAHDSFQSRHGDTREGGLHAPSECGQFWYRWLPRDDHFADAGSLKARALKHMRSEVTKACRLGGHPIVFKNLNAGQRLRVISRAFPHARVIWCRRDPRFTIQSIIAARQKLRWPADQIWSIRPRNWRELEALPVVDQVAAQVFHLEKQIEKDLELFRSAQVRIIQFENWISDPASVSCEIGEWLRLDPRPGGRKAFITNDRNRVHDLAQFETITRSWETLNATTITDSAAARG